MHLYSAERAEDLAQALAEVLIADPLDPMESEWMAVPSDGIRRWVTLELARHLGATRPGGGDGVAANFQRAYPGTLRSIVLDAAAYTGTGPSAGKPRADPWQIDRMVWSLLAIFDDLARHGSMPEFTQLPAGASRYTRVRAVADLFDRYHLHRPEMIRAWASPGRPDAQPVDGSGKPISTFAAWQPRLWRLLRDEVGMDSPPEQMETILAMVRNGQLDLAGALPSRLIFFGFTSLVGRDFLPLVESVALHREVHLFLLSPHQFDSGDLVSEWPHPGTDRIRLRSDDPTGALIRQPLLRTWGRLPRESALLLADGLAPDTARLAKVPSFESPRRSLLERLQADIRGNAEAKPVPVGADDRSVQFHSCFGPMRQVQVARDAILHLLNNPSSGLTEEDVLVVCPGLEKFAPLVEAVFGPSSGSTDPVDSDGSPILRYRIADRSIRSANPVLGALASLLDLVSGRFELAPVLDFIALAPVGERFGFDDADLAVLAEWAVEARVRWGLDTGHRAGYGIPATVVGNSWQAALDRLLMGAAVADSDRDLAIGNVAPFGVDSGDAELLGSFAFILGRLAALAERSAEADLTIAGWVDVLRRACSELFKPPDRAGWQFEALDRLLADIVESASATRRGSEVTLDLLDVRRLMEGRLEMEPGRPDFFRGGITVTSMASLRWVPFRIVCVLGLDQDSMDSSAPDAADLIAAAPQIGDPDPRSESRQWLLEAILAARDHLVIVRDGRDVRSNHPVPQVVPAAELFDALVSLVPVGDRQSITEVLEVSHPRHAFDEACFVRNEIVDGRVWSFSERDLAGARRRRARPTQRGTFLEQPLDVEVAHIIELAELHAFLRDPVNAFLRQTLDVRLPRKSEESDDILPVEVVGLDQYRIGQDLLDARIQGIDDEEWRTFERARGSLPPGVLEEGLYSDLMMEIDEIVLESGNRGVQFTEPELYEVDVTLSGGTRIVGTVPLTLTPETPGPGRVVFSRPKEANRLQAWLDLMALVASDPHADWRSVVVTRRKSGQRVLKPIDLVPSAPPAGRLESAQRALSLVVDLYRRGMSEPLPLFPEYSPAVHAAKGEDGAWKSFGGRGDGTRPAVRLVFGDVDSGEIEDMPHIEGDPGVGGARVERYARHLWGTVGATSTALP